MLHWDIVLSSTNSCVTFLSLGKYNCGLFLALIEYLLSNRITAHPDQVEQT